ncbi:MAG: glycosyltransferase family 39 protein [Flavobacteriales bacterium]|nr:glycosyltransferase family 39 protein [Flavobacteriales bacterium]
MKQFFKKEVAVFIISYIAISLFYSYHKILPLRPQPYHQWRQADCLSLTYNYYDGTAGFFEPAIHQYFSDENTSGKSAGEFPLLYYAMAKMWQVFGQSEFLYRMFTYLLCFISLFALYKLLQELLENKFYAYIISLLVITSPVIAYYSINFLTDVPAFNLVLLGWYYYYQYFKRRKKYLFLISVLFFALGALLKISAGMSLIALFGIYCIEYLLVLLKFRKPTVLHYKLYEFSLFFLSFLMIAAWYLYAEHYNSLHGGKYTFNGFWPVWEMDSANINRVLGFAKDFMIHQVFSFPTLIILFLMQLLLLLKKHNLFFALLNLFLFIGVLLYLILWFNALDNHDYYLINPIILPLAVITSFLFFLKEKYIHVFRSLSFKILLSLLLVFNIVYASNNLKMRHWNVFSLEKSKLLPIAFKSEVDFWDYIRWGVNTNFYTIEDYNRSIGIKPNDVVISLPDNSINISLYLMNQKGYNNFVNKLSDSTAIIQRIHLGAKYLFISDSSVFSLPHVKPFLKYPLGDYNQSISVFDLQPYKINEH